MFVPFALPCCRCLLLPLNPTPSQGPSLSRQAGYTVSWWPPGLGVALGVLHQQVTTAPWPHGCCFCSWNLLRMRPWPQPRGPHCLARGAGWYQRQLLLCPRHRGSRCHSSQGVCEPQGRDEWVRAEGQHGLPTWALSLPRKGAPAPPQVGSQGPGHGIPRLWAGESCEGYFGAPGVQPCYSRIHTCLCLPSETCPGHMDRR